MQLRGSLKALLGAAVAVVIAVLVLLIVFGGDLFAQLDGSPGFVYLLQREEEVPPLLSANVQQGSGLNVTGAPYAPRNTEITEHYILIGDSRTKGMNQATGMSTSALIDVIAEVSMGYSWMMDTALPEASYLESNRYVFLLGVNDLDNIDRYLAAYEDLSEQGVHVTLVTVGPVEEGRGGYTTTNYQIDTFNEKLKQAEYADILDLNAFLWEYGFTTLDGLHYTNETYEQMELFLLSELK